MSNANKPLIMSMCGPLTNKIKTCLLYAMKNKNLAQKLRTTVDLLCEQLLPQFCKNKENDMEALDQLHSLMYLLAHKTQQVFYSKVIHTCIDQNWDLKGFKQVLTRVFNMIGVRQFNKVTELLQNHINFQNMQSSSCIKAIGSFIRNPNKKINDDDLNNPISTYETSFEFVREDIEKYRSQRIKHECFSVLHPWAYDLDQVDFKYIVNNNLTQKICNALNTQTAQVFWLTFFKSFQAVSCDDFFGAIREIAEINKIPQFYEDNVAKYQQIAIESDFVMSTVNNASQICILVQQVCDAGQQNGFQALRDQIKTYNDAFPGSDLLDTPIDGYRVESNPKFDQFSSDLAVMKMNELSADHLNAASNLQRSIFQTYPNQAATHKLHMKFESVDTEELKDLEISFEGNQGVFKVGEGEGNHYQIPNDKKLWESQFMIVCKDGKYYIRDLGVVHTSRIKVDKTTEVRIQQDSLIDLGKVVHYHFDKVTHSVAPTVDPSAGFYVMRPNSNDYRVEEDAQDPPTLRARPTWVSSDENKDLIQKEIILEAGQQNDFSIGRSMKRDVQIKLKAVSADHCNVSYTPQKGWYISEKGKDKLSSNGTFVFMKSSGQMADHEPSDLIPLHDGMIISFINYEIRVNLEKKDANEIEDQQNALQKVFEASMKTPQMGDTFKASAEPVVQEEKSQAVEAEEEKEVEKAVSEKAEVVQDAASEKKEEAAEEKVEEAVEKASEKAEDANNQEEENKEGTPRSTYNNQEESKPAENAQQEKVESEKAEEKKEEAAEEKKESPRAEEKKEEAVEEKKESPRAEAQAEPAKSEQAQEEAKSEAKEEAAVEEKKESPRAEAQAEPAKSEQAQEEAKSEAKEEAAVEEKKESPRAEAQAEPAKSEQAQEEAKSEAKAEAAVEEKKDDSPKAEEKKEEVKEAVEEKKEEEKTADDKKSDAPAADEKKEEVKEEAKSEAVVEKKEEEKPADDKKSDAPAAEEKKEEVKEEAKAEVVENKKDDSPKAEEKKEEVKEAVEQKKEEEKPADDKKSDAPAAEEKKEEVKEEVKAEEKKEEEPKKEENAAADKEGDAAAAK